MTPLDAKRPLQLNAQGQLQHFLSLDGLPRELLTEILDTADSFLEVGGRAVKKVPLLRGKTICNVFFENSTRTRTTFELAADTVARTAMAPAELPLGVLTAFIGVPMFLWMLRRFRGRI